MNRLMLKQGREKPLLRHHPWVFSGAIASVDGNPQPGETIAILSAKGQFLAWGAYSPHSQWPGGHTAPTHRFVRGSGVGMKAIRLTANS